jgi:hypothetical protein
MLDPTEIDHLRRKKEAIKDDTVKILLAPQKRANTPSLQDIRDLEVLTVEAATLPDRHAAGIFRLMSGNSGRFNDIQHVQPKTHKKTPTTKEFTAWQTKTTGINENQRPRPLVCVLHSFSGVQWWVVLDNTLEALQKMEEFKDMDYLLPAPTRDRTGFLPRPCSNNQALRWLRQLRAIHSTNEEDLKRLTLPSFRVWAADMAYQMNIDRSLRKYIGNWAHESTADVYTREHRTVICNIWDIITKGIHKNEALTHSRTVPEDLEHEFWETGPAATSAEDLIPEKDGLETEEQKERNRKMDNSKLTYFEVTNQAAEEDLRRKKKPKPAMPMDEDGFGPARTPADKIPAPHGPATVAVNKKPTGKDRTVKIHLFTPNRRAIGCGWTPRANQVESIVESDYDSKTMVCCTLCFRQYEFPSTWTKFCWPHEEESDPSDVASAATHSDSSADTASEDEAVKLIL